MEDYNLVPRAKKAIEHGVEIANKNKHSKVNAAHLLCGIIENSTIHIKAVFDKLNVNLEGLEKALLLELKDKNPSFFSKKRNEKVLSPEIFEILEKSKIFSEKFNQFFIGIEHILYITISECEVIKSFLKEKDFPIEECLEAIEYILDPKPNSENSESKNGKPLNQEAKFNEKNLTKYCSILNDEVKKYSSKIEGRKEELQKLIEILSCKTKNNAILVGDAGVGKTAIVEALAQRINSFDCPVYFSGIKIYCLDVGLMVAGTKYRGQFEERFKGLIDELKKEDKAVLFIDEIHSIVGTGSTEGSLDLANMIKPALARGEIKCIGATTAAEYKKYFEKDSALNRRFQIINVEEPSKEQTLEILKKAKIDYEDYHGVEYTDEILNNIIVLADKYMPYRKFPDKAFDILDRIGARAKIEKFIIPQDIKEMEKKLIEIMEDDDFDKNHTKEKCESLLKDFIEKRDVWFKGANETLFKIQEDHLYEVISKDSGLNKDKIKLDSSKSFTSLKQELESKIYDQSEVIDKVYNTLLCAKAGIRKNKKTLANFLFIGSTGVGKTHTAKIIAEKFYNKTNCFLHLDMAEYIEKNSISKLIGTSAGYVGYEEGGLLSEFVRKNPNSLILFDEIDKATPEIVNILLKIMDEGELTDSFNRKIDFSNTIIVLTGNTGAEYETARSMGFVNTSTSKERTQEYTKAIKKNFRPELLARIDETVIFNKEFTKNGLFKIIEENLIEISESLLEKNITLKQSDQVKEYLYDLVSKEGMNARNVKKIIRNNFELPLCEFIVSHEKISEIDLKVVDNQIHFV